MLKQSAFFEKIRKRNLSIQQYHYLYFLYNDKNITLPKVHAEKMPADLITNQGKLSEKGKSFIKSLEQLFKPLKNITDLELLGENFSEYIDKYTLIFPAGKLPNTKYARGNKKSIQSNFVWFFQEYEYDWNTIITATQLYVKEYAQKEYLHMRTAMYFIKKEQNRTIISDLATYCDAVLNGAVEEQEEREEEENEIIIGKIV